MAASGVLRGAFLPCMKFLFLIVTTFAGICFLLVSCGATRFGYDSAPYRVKSSHDGFELRDYPVLTVVATADEGKADRDERFKRLFGYISGANEDKKKIAMTTPVFMDESAKRGEMMFVLPSGNSKQAPAPKTEMVKVKQLPARTMAVLRYSGGDSRELIQSMEQRLREQMKAAGLKPAGEAMIGYYDPPWIPGFARRNEVLIPVD